MASEGISVSREGETTKSFSFVDMLENMLGIDIDGDGRKVDGLGRGLIDGLEAVSLSHISMTQSVVTSQLLILKF